MPNAFSIHGAKGGLLHRKGTISAQDINRAVRTVRVKNVGKRWSVKKVAAAKMWFFQNPENALAKAIELAAPEEWSVVVHDGRKIIKVISPDEFARPVVEFGLKRRQSRFHRARRRQHHGVAASRPA